MTPLIIPSPDELRAQIRARHDELRALRQLLRLAVAADDAEAARSRQRPLDSLDDIAAPSTRGAAGAMTPDTPP